MNRLYRSMDDRVLAGVAGGMAETYGMDPALVRIVWALLILFTGGLFLLLYIVMAIVVPNRPPGVQPAYGAYTNWAAGPPPEPGSEAPTSTYEAGGSPPPPPPADPSWTGPGYGPAGARRRPEDNNAPIIIGAILILVGGLFLLRQFVNIDFARLWPVAVILIGLVLIVSAFGRSRRQA